MGNPKNWKPNLQECENVLRELVKINTCQPEGNEERIVDWILRWLPENVEHIKVLHTDNRASLIVKISGKSDEGGIAFIGHLDTVACNQIEEWKYPPHQAAVDGSIMYGRGTADMKGGVAAMLLVMKQLIEEESVYVKPVYFCFTSDEENKGIGIKSLVEGGYLEKIDEVVICEPSDEKINICEKGALWIDVSVEGIASHASRPEVGINAVEVAMELAGQVKMSLERNGKHPILGEATAAVTKMQGGIMTNIIPSNAKMELDIRTTPGVQHEKIIRDVETAIKTLESKFCGVKIDISIMNNRPPLETDESHEYVQHILQMAKQFGISDIPGGNYFYTDASQLIPTIPVPFVIAGPGDDKQAHCMNEQIELDSVVRFAALYHRCIAERLSET